jgi:hypothetical protein
MPDAPFEQGRNRLLRRGEPLDRRARTSSRPGLLGVAAWLLLECQEPLDRMPSRHLRALPALRVARDPNGECARQHLFKFSEHFHTEVSRAIVCSG